MPAQLSDELCKLIIAYIYEMLHDITTIAALVKCDTLTGYRIITGFNDTGSLHAIPRGHRPRTTKIDGVQYILALIKANPALYLDELQVQCKTSRNLDVFLAMLCRTLYRHG
jgi:hypothetical protein